MHHADLGDEQDYTGEIIESYSSVCYMVKPFTFNVSHFWKYISSIPQMQEISTGSDILPIPASQNLDKSIQTNPLLCQDSDLFTRDKTQKPLAASSQFVFSQRIFIF